MDCKLWTGGKTGTGYPAMKKDGKTVYVRRVIWEENFGPVPDGKVVGVTCGNRLCVEPTHLCLRDPGSKDRARGARGRFVKEKRR